MGDPYAAIVWDPRFLRYDFGPDHPFSERSRGLAVDLLRDQLAGDSTRVAWVGAVDPASRSTLERFHEAAYLDFVEEAGARDGILYLDTGDTPSFPNCFEEAARIVAGTEAALEWTLAHRRPAFEPAGGLHHAHPGRASGFCIFNDVALAVKSALARNLRVAYIDIDAHHGDGVMYGFYDSGRVLAIDVHQDGRTLFPGTGFPNETGRGDGAGLKVNLPLPPTAGDGALLPLFRRVVPTLLRSFGPDLIVLQHGVDGHMGDPLAQLQYSSTAYDEIDATILGLSRELTGGRLLVTGGGGYRPDAVARVLARTGLALAGAPVPPPAATVPEEWRQQYRRALAELAPVAWSDVEAPAPTVWSDTHESKLIETLEAELGTRFPSV